MGRHEDMLPLQGQSCQGNYDQASHTSDTEPFEWEPRPKPVNKWIILGAGIALVVLLLMLVATLHHEDRLSERENHFHRAILSLPWDATPSDMQPNDFWAIHDLILVGFSAPFMKRGTPGNGEVATGALDLLRLLPELHPFRPCRDALKKLPMVTDENIRASIIEASLISWSCLPAQFEADHFEADNPAFLPSALHDEEKVHDARNSRIRDRSLLGVCADTHWDRACSIWASIHSMALRADALGLNALYYRAIMPILLGGVTLCGGCTLHLMSLLRPVADPAILEDAGTMFCANKQCGATKDHMESLTPCIGRASMDCEPYQNEIRDILAFRDYARAVFDDVSQPISHFFVALHNMVSSSIDQQKGQAKLEGRKRHLYCIKEVLYSLPLALTEDTGASRRSILTAANASLVGRGVPGLDAKHRLLECDNNP